MQEAVIVVDTIGQLRSLYSMASLVFVGKSLCVGEGKISLSLLFMVKPSSLAQDREFQGYCRLF